MSIPDTSLLAVKHNSLKYIVHCKCIHAMLMHDLKYKFNVLNGFRIDYAFLYNSASVLFI